MPRGLSGRFPAGPAGLSPGNEHICALLHTVRLGMVAVVLFHHNVEICAAKTEGAHASAPRRAGIAANPGTGLGVNIEKGVLDPHF